VRKHLQRSPYMLSILHAGPIVNPMLHQVDLIISSKIFLIQNDFYLMLQYNFTSSPFFSFVY
jgi:hypothetical protein